MPDNENPGNPGWTPDIARAMTDALLKLDRTQTETNRVLSALRDELAALREDRRQVGDRRSEPRTGTDG